MAIKLVTLDLDDTLWDSRAALAAAEQAVYAYLARHCPRITAALSPADMARQRLALMRERPDLAHDLTRLRLAALAALAREHGYDSAVSEGAMAVFFEHRNAVRVYPDTEPALATLAERYELVAVSNGNASVAATGLRAYFRYAVSPAEAGAAKPDPGMFRYVLERSGVRPEEVVHVGDEPHTDILGAWRSGIPAVWLNRRGEHWPAIEPAPRAEIASLAHLADALADLM